MPDRQRHRKGMAPLESSIGRSGFFQEDDKASSECGVDSVRDYIYLRLLLVYRNSVAPCVFGGIVLFPE